MTKILHLTLHKKYFDLIASGEKKEEYRMMSPHWASRIGGKTFDEIHFTNGYGKSRPFMRVEFLGFRVPLIDDTGCYYVLQLGKILEIRNWTGNIYCEYCKGKGKQGSYYVDFMGYEHTSETCPECKGTGKRAITA